MARRGHSGALYWAKHVALALVLVALAVVVIQLQTKPTHAPAPEAVTESKSVAKGLSEFYREFRMSPSAPIESVTGDFVLDVNRPGQNVDSQLQRMSSSLKPANSSWKGEHKHRTFKAGNTLREAISVYAQQEGMQVIWDLEQDFIIKYQFQMDNTVAGTLAKIAAAIDNNFEGDVATYVCPAQRSLVVTSNHTEYLKQHCQVVEQG